MLGDTELVINNYSPPSCRSRPSENEDMKIPSVTRGSGFFFSSTPIDTRPQMLQIHVSAPNRTRGNISTLSVGIFIKNVKN